MIIRAAKEAGWNEDLGRKLLEEAKEKELEGRLSRMEKRKK